MRSFCLPIVVVAVLAGAAPAAAAPGIVAPDATPVAGPVVGGDNVLWTQYSGHNYDFVAGGDNKDPVALFTIFTEDSAPDDGGGSTVYLPGGLVAGGPATFAIGTSSLFTKVRGFTEAIYAGPVQSEVDPYLTATGDEFNGPVCPRIDTDDFDLDGDQLLWATKTQPNCNPPVETVHLRGPQSGSDRVLDAGLASDVSGLRLSGKYAAWRQTVSGTTEVVLWDLATDKVVLRVPGNPPSFDVDTSGRLTVVAADRTASWREPGKAAAHLLPLTGVVSVAGGDGRLGYERAVAGGAELGTIALEDGAVAVPVATVPANYPARWDFDGARIAWADETCVARPIRTEIAPTTPRPTDATGGFAASCPVAIDTSRLVVSQKTGRATVRIVCAQGCSVRLSLSAPRLFKGSRKATAVVNSGGAAKVVLKLSAKERRKLGRLRTASGKVTARSLLRGGDKTYNRPVKLKLG
jgi:hypothetical protein